MLYLPALPDEIFSSYLGRLARCNGYSQRRDFMRAMCLDLSKRLPEVTEIQKSKVNPIHPLALASNISPPDFARKHTLLPYLNGITSVRRKHHHAEINLTGALRQNFNLGTSKTIARFCIACIQADINQHGMSYWHRTHYLIGTYTCHKHDMPLRYTSLKDAAFQSPASLVENSLDFDHDLVAACSTPSVQEFLRLSVVALHSMRATDRAWVCRVLQPLADEHRIGQIFDLGFSPPALLSDRVLKVFPRSWLKEVMPNIREKTRGKFFADIDGMLTANITAPSVISFLLAACALTGAPAKLEGLITAEGDRSLLFPRRLRKPEKKN